MGRRLFVWPGGRECLILGGGAAGRGLFFGLFAGRMCGEVG